ncbi:MAG: hypothetical protein KJZ92_17755 [Rhodocyclaceae bacterium]|jgi:hypothetical protein|nr:hypothetical protein [Rhodocyclaceae bacterium]MCL4683098.1 hypothetical protein [Rhodocyclaceae bacterium]
MRRLAPLIAAFAYMVLLIEAVRAAAAWWRGEAALTALDYALVAALPLLAWVWFRYFSMFRKGCAKGVCAPPGKPSGE